MKVIDIDDPSNVKYPLRKQDYEEPRIIYHGTGSLFADIIQKQGWIRNKLPYDFKDVKDVMKAIESIAYDDLSVPYGTLQAFTLGTDYSYVGDKGAAFTQDYWLARRYSFFKSGETLQRLIDTIDEFLEIASNDVSRKRQLAWVSKKKANVLSDQFGGQELPPNFHLPPDLEAIISHYNDKYRLALNNLRSTFFLQNEAKKLKQIRQKYEISTQKSYPVVLVVEVAEEWVENWSNDLDLRAKADIPSSAIRYRINFKRGLGDCIPDPSLRLLPW